MKLNQMWVDDFETKVKLSYFTQKEVQAWFWYGIILSENKVYKRDDKEDLWIMLSNKEIKEILNRINGRLAGDKELILELTTILLE